MKMNHGLAYCVAAATLWAGTARARGDDKADQILKEVAAKAAAARSLTGTLTVYQKSGQNDIVSKGTVRLLKPNKALIALKGGPYGSTIASDGKDVINLMPDNQYMKMPADPHGKNVGIGFALPVTMFFDPAGAVKMFGSQPYSYAGQETIGNVAYDVLSKTERDNTFKLYVNPDRLLTRLTVDIKQDQQTIKLGAELTDIKLDAPVTVGDLTFTLPKTAKLYKPPDYNAKLLPVGQLAEKFDLVALKGDNITFDRVAKGKKAVLVNFWFYG